MTRAVISLGTNTVRLLVVREDDHGAVEQLEHAQIGTRLGEGLRDGGRLAPAAVERTLAAVATFVERVRAYRATLVSIATSAMRRADDAGVFAARVEAIGGVPLRVLAGDVEAEATFRGATSGAPLGRGRVAVVDVGGGSTECAVGSDGTLERAQSIEIGSVRVAERFPNLGGSAPGAAAREAAALARAYAAAMLAPYAALRPVVAVHAVAGTPATVAAIAARSHVDRVAGTTLERAVLDATVDGLLELDLAARRALPGMLSQRADILPAGAIVLSETLRLLGANDARVEADDLLLGYLLMTRDDARARDSV